MTRHIREDDLNAPEVVALLAAHLEHMHSVSPPGSVHALDLEALRAPEVTFWSAWHEEDLLGVGALKELDARTGEIKSMRTAEAHRGQGVASDMLRHIHAAAQARGYTRLYLETGAQEAFAPARAFYERHGFAFCDPFGDYIEDSNSVFMTRAL